MNQMLTVFQMSAFVLKCVGFLGAHDGIESKILVFTGRHLSPRTKD